MPRRMLGAALLDVEVYEEVEADTDATEQAALVVALVAMASALGDGALDTTGFITGFVAAFLAWGVWAGITYLIGDKLLGGTATWGELLRTIGFALSPGLLYALGAVPGVGPGVTLAVALWILVAVLIAIRQALDFGTGRALLTALFGFLAYIAIMLAAALLAGLGPTLV